MKKLTFTLLLFLLIGTISNAQTGETELSQELEKKESDLNTLLLNLKNTLSSDDQKALESSQADWIKFRESNCSFKSKKESEGGVLANKLFIDCKIEATELRTKELKKLLISGF